MKVTVSSISTFKINVIKNEISFLLGTDCTDELEVSDVLFLLVLVQQSFGRKPEMNRRIFSILYCIISPYVNLKKCTKNVKL
jgi:hypothetical protein